MVYFYIKKKDSDMFSFVVVVQATMCGSLFTAHTAMLPLYPNWVSYMVINEAD